MSNITIPKRIGAFMLAVLMCLSIFPVTAFAEGEEPAEEIHEHAWSGWTVVTEATCSSAGLQQRSCGCGQTETAEISTLPHAFGEWTVTKEATCTEAGEQQRICTVCGAVETADVPVVPHSYGDWAVTKEATCTEPGEQQHACTVCSAVETAEIPAAPHSYGEWTVTKEATCTEPGEHWHACTVCGAVETAEMPVAPHSYGEWTVTTEATCTEAGERQRACSVCNAVETEVVPPAHSFSDWTVVTEVTCTENGEKQRVCSACGESETEVVPAAHSFVEWAVMTEATCTENGEKQRVCSVCGETESETIPPVGHDWDEDNICTVCGAEKKTEAKKPAQNFFGEAAGLLVAVQAGEGVFPRGTVMSVSNAGVAMDQVTGAFPNAVSVAGVSISFTRESKEVKPDGAVTITLTDKTPNPEAAYSAFKISKGQAVGIDASVYGTSAEFSVDKVRVYGLVKSVEPAEEVAPPTCTVNFSVDGEVFFSTSVPEGQSLDSLPDAPQKQGYDFICWFAGGEEITADTIVTVDMTVEAVYMRIDEPMTFTVTFVADEDVVAERTVPENEVIGELPDAPEKEYHDFTAWVLEKESVKETVSADTVVTEDMTVVAEYAVQSPAWTFDSRKNGIVVKAPKGALPFGTLMEVTPVTVSQKVINDIEGELDGYIQSIAAFDITFIFNGKEIQPELPVSVMMNNSAATGSSKVFHVENDSATAVDKAAVGNGYAWFSADSFSVYAVVTSGEDARLLVKFMNGPTEVASIYVKSDDNMEQVLYDPGVGTIASDVFFRGWTTVEDYTAETAPLTIEDVRTEVSGMLPPATDGQLVTYYAMLFKAYTITYYDEHDISLGQEEVYFRADSTEPSQKYTVNMAYTIQDSEHNFEGWKVKEGGTNISGFDPEEHGGEGTFYNNDTEIDISGSVEFGVNAPAGHWFVFDENGKGGTYNAPAFIKAGEVTQKPCDDENMTRLGYTFGGWFDSEENANNLDSQDGLFVFGGELTALTKIYARWIPNDTANYTVLIYKQTADLSGYEFAASYVGIGNVGDSIAGTAIVIGTEGDLTYVTLGSDHHRYGGIKSVSHGSVSDPFTGFTLNPGKTTDDTITPEGDAVAEIYFDRVEYTLKFYVTKYDSGAQRYKGCSKEGDHEFSGDWDKDLQGQTTIGGQQPVSDDGIHYYFPITAHYGQNISSLWPTNVQNSPPFVSWILMKTAKAYVARGGGRNTVKGAVGILNEQILGDLTSKNGNYLTARYENNAHNWTYYIYFGDAKGNFPTTPDKTLTGIMSSQSGSTSQHPPEYDGYMCDETKSRFENPLQMHYYYVPKQYTLKFMDGAYVDGDGGTIQNHSSNPLSADIEVVYGKDISDYNDYKPTLPATETGYVFEGWCADKACNAKYTFDKMPLGTLTVYAKWRQIEYRAFLHPNYPSDATGDIDWGSSSQKLSFRLSYGETISDPKGKLVGYEFVGWYKDAACTQAFNGSVTPMNEANVTTPYDYENTFTDTYDSNGNFTPTEKKDANRWWITKQYNIYAKWRKTLEGASGIGVIYDVGEGSGTAGDTNIYVDGARAPAAAAVTAPAGKQFAYWVVQTWDDDAGKYTDDENSVKVFPGDTFQVLKSDARIQDITPSGTSGDTKKYTVQLRAAYVPSERPTPTHIYWYKNTGTDAFRKDENLAINKAVAIAPAQTRDGYIFLGWARVPIGNSLAEATAWEAASSNWTQNLTKNDLYLYYTADGSYHINGTGGAVVTVTQVAADEDTPYHAMFAVWGKSELKVTKTADKTEGLKENDEITYTITVTNTGDVTLSNLCIIDELVHLKETYDIVLEPGDSESVSTELTKYKVTRNDVNAGKIVNTATATAQDIKGNEVKGKAECTVTTDSKEIIVTISGVQDTVLYNGAAHTVIGFLATSNNAEYNKNIDNNFTFTGGVEVTEINAGTYTLDLSKEMKNLKNKNEKFTNVEFRFNPNNHTNILTILPRTVTLTSASDQKLYDGSSLTNDNVAVGGDGFVGGQGAAYNVTGAQADAGSSRNSFTYTLTGGALAGNYTITKNEGTLTIRPRTVVLTSASDEKVYDGEALTNDTVTVTGDGFAAGEGATWTVTGTQTDKGSSENTFTYTLNTGTKAENYNITTQFGTLSVRGIEEIADDDTPLAGPAWALINLIATILTVCTAAGMIVTYFRKKEDEDEEDDGTKRELTDEEKAGEEEENERKKSKFFGLIPGLGSVITFLLTEDMRNPMILTDRWTVLMLAILAIGAGLAYLTRNGKPEEEQPEEA